MILRKLVVVVGILLGAGLAFAAPAAAHATVVASDPRDGARLQTAPSTVTITFDENVGLGFLHVTDQDGNRVDGASAYHPGGDANTIADRLKAGLGDSSYTASFRVVSADGHPVAGTIRFVVGAGALVHGSLPGGTAADTATSTALDVLRWTSYAGLALLGGSWLLFTVWPDGRDDRRARRLLWTGWGAATVGAAGELMLQGPYAAGDGFGAVFQRALLSDTLHSRYGEFHSVRLLLLGALALLLAQLLQDRSERADLTRWLALALGVGVAATLSGTGHASTTSPTWLSISFDTLHLCAMAAWLGGLAYLVGCVLPRRDADELRTTLPVFSSVAFVSVVVLAVTGAYAAWRGIGTIDAIFDTTYGLLVVTKIVLFAVLVALGNLSRRQVRHRTVAYAMTATALDEPTAATTDVELLRRSVLLEVIIGAVVLAVTAVLVGEPRGREALAAQYREPVSATASLGDGRSVTVTVDPGTRGPVDIAVMLHGVTRASVAATATQHDAEIGPLPIALAGHGGGHFDGTATLPVAGAWDIDLVVTTSQFDATTTDVTIHLH